MTQTSERQRETMIHDAEKFKRKRSKKKKKTEYPHFFRFHFDETSTVFFQLAFQNFHCFKIFCKKKKGENQFFAMIALLALTLFFDTSFADFKQFTNYCCDYGGTVSCQVCWFV